MDKLEVSILDKVEIEKFILINIVGLMESLNEGAIKIEDCEQCLCSPYSVEKLNTLGINTEVVDLIEQGCELEDVESLVPQKLKDEINKIKVKAIKLLSQFPNKTDTMKKWID